jgi:Zn-dependent protease with chaperone function
MEYDHGLIGEGELQKTAAEKNRVRRKRENARQRGEALEQRLAAAADLKPGGGARFAALSFALLIHGLTLAILFGSVEALLSGRVPLYVVALLGFGLVWQLRPRLGKRPGAGWAKRDKLPHLFAILDRVGTATGAPTPHYVGIDTRFNASTGRLGLRHEPILRLGAPLWQILDGDERLALLGHELGHQVNGDTTQGLLVATARRSLHEWRVLLYPSAGPRGRYTMRGTAGIAQLLVPVILLPFYLMLTALQRFYGWIQIHVSLRAEFLADDIAAQVASTEAALALMRKLDTRTSVEAYVTRTKFARASSRKKPSDEDAMEMWLGLRDYMKTIPDHEFIRQARASEVRGTRIDDSHPAHYLRARLLEARPHRDAAVSVSEEEWLAVDIELAVYMAQLGRTMLR